MCGQIFVANCIVLLEEATMSSASDKSLFLFLEMRTNMKRCPLPSPPLPCSCLWCHSSGVRGRQYPALL